jgi:hypothetical protein
MREREPAVAVGGARNLQRRRSEAAPPLAIATLFAAYAIAYVGLLLVRPFGGSTFVAVEDVMGNIPPLIAAVCALAAAVASAGQARQGWALIGVGCLLWGLGDITWTVYETVLGQDPFPSLADVGYLAMVPVLALGLISLTSGEQRKERFLPTLDGLALVLACAGFVWYIVLTPTYNQSGLTGWERLISSAYPIGDLVVIYALIIAVQRNWRRARDVTVLETLLMGMFFIIAADIGFAYQTLHDTYAATSVVNLGWPSGFLMIGYAAVLGVVWPFSPADSEIAPVVKLDWLLPGVLLVMLLALAGAAVREDSLRVSAPLYAMTAVAALALAARVAINLGMARDVEGHRERALAWIHDQIRLGSSGS